MNNCIGMINGTYIDPLNFQPEEIKLEDLVIGLSQTCRFNGQLSLNNFYSVCQHSIMVGKYAGQSSRGGFHAKYLELAGLCHDLIEALSPTSDVPSPSKNKIAVYAFDKMLSVKDYEKEGTKRILQGLGLDYLQSYMGKNNPVHYWDKVMCNSESYYLRGYKCWDDVAIIKERIIPRSRQESYDIFMNRWEYLTK